MKFWIWDEGLTNPTVKFNEFVYDLVKLDVKSAGSSAKITAKVDFFWFTFLSIYFAF